MRVTKAHFPRLDVLLIDLAPRASGVSPAERSLEVAELDQRDRGSRVALKVHGLRDQGLHQRLLAVRLSGAPCAPVPPSPRGAGQGRQGCRVGLGIQVNDRRQPLPRTQLPYLLLQGRAKPIRQGRISLRRQDPDARCQEHQHDA